MFTRTFVVVATSTCLWAGVASAQQPVAADHPATVNQRIEHQRDRIQAGVADDQLTKGEATRLKVDDARIQAQAKAERQANGGTLTPAERKQIDRELDRTSRQIYRGRHNNRKPTS